MEFGEKIVAFVAGAIGLVASITLLAIGVSVSIGAVAFSVWAIRGIIGG